MVKEAKKGIKEQIGKLLYNAGLDYSPDKFIKLIAINTIGLAVGAALIFINLSIIYSLIAAFVISVVYLLIIYILLTMSVANRVAKMEESLPDFLTLMASNIRSGLTPDRALMVSIRKEFGPLTKEIEKAAKLAISGRPLDEAFQSIGENIQSVSFAKAIRLIVEGIRSGGNLAELLENTAADVRKFNAIKEEVNSNITIYELFLFIAAGIGAPLLHATANFLITIVFKVRELVSIDTEAMSSSQLSGLGLLKTTSSLTPEVAFSFSIISILVSTFFSSLAIGIIMSGRSESGLKYFPVLLLIALVVFFGTKAALETLFRLIFLA
jgi:archaellum biogenesis protein FlaJ (TadC family)